MVIPFILDIVILQKQKTQSEKGYFLYGDSIHIVTTSVCKGYFFYMVILMVMGVHVPDSLIGYLVGVLGTTSATCSILDLNADWRIFISQSVLFWVHNSDLETVHNSACMDFAL
jgi:hypothetical protein